jgi:hypothetical protein
MRTPLRPLPDSVTRWVGGVRYLRWQDAVLAWVVSWVVAELSLADGGSGLHGVLATIVAVAGAGVPWLRVRWRPVTGTVGLVVSRRLRPGDRAWYIRPADAELVLVTARRRLRIVIARAESADEGMAVRRTRVVLLPAE